MARPKKLTRRRTFRLSETGDDRLIEHAGDAQKTPSELGRIILERELEKMSRQKQRHERKEGNSHANN